MPVIPTTSSSLTKYPSPDQLRLTTPIGVRGKQFLSPVHVYNAARTGGGNYWYFKALAWRLGQLPWLLDVDRSKTWKVILRSPAHITPRDKSIHITVSIAYKQDGVWKTYASMHVYSMDLVGTSVHFKDGGSKTIREDTLSLISQD